MGEGGDKHTNKISKRYIKVQASGWGGQAHRHTDRQTHRHINTMTQPGLGAGPSEKHRKFRL